MLIFFDLVNATSGNPLKKIVQYGKNLKHPSDQHGHVCNRASGSSTTRSTVRD